MTGCGSRWIAIIISLQVSNKLRALGSEQPAIADRSCPAQKARAPPRRITACTDVSAAVSGEGGDEIVQSACQSALPRSGR